MTLCTLTLRGRLAALSSAFTLAAAMVGAGPVAFGAENAPVPLLKHGQAVTWWFVFKFNAATFPGCDGDRACPFGGQVQDYRAFSQQFVYASSNDRALQKGGGCLGDTTADPVGATFDEVYNGSYHYVVWNDQFYDDPHITGCGKSCGGPWGHSKGMLAWDNAGDGFVMQVSTPSWPAAGSKLFPRATDGNTLGCVKDNDVKVSQDFFALKLTEDDVLKVLKALKNASVVTDPTNPQVVSNGGPEAIQQLVSSLGAKSTSTTYTQDTLSSGVQLISKPSKLHVPPWQIVSAALGGVSLRTATWWAYPKIYSTTATTKLGCWAEDLKKPGPIQIAITGQWAGTSFSLKGGPGNNANHAKVAISTSGTHHYTIFGDMNQQGALSPGYSRPNQKCSSSQNGRGGLFYVLDDRVLQLGVKTLIKGETAPTKRPAS